MSIMKALSVARHQRAVPPSHPSPPTPIILGNGHDRFSITVGGPYLGLPAPTTAPTPPWVTAARMRPTNAGPAASAAFQAVVDAAQHSGHAGSTPAEMIASYGAIERLLPDAEAVFAARAALIETAQTEILLAEFVWEQDSQAAQRNLQAILGLQERVRARHAAGGGTPVQLRMVLDTAWIAGHRGLYTDLEEFLRRLDPTLVHAELAYVSAVSRGVMHQKLLVQDNRYALVTGANDEKNFDAPNGWHDEGVLLSGPHIVATIRTAWNDDRLHAVPTFGALPIVPADAAALNAPARPGDVPIAFLSRRQHGLLGRHTDVPLCNGLLAMLEQTQQTLHVINPALNARPLKAAVVDLVKRGAVVKLLLNLELDRDLQNRWAEGDNARTAYALYDALLASPEGEAAADRLEIRWHSADRQRASARGEAGMSHAKSFSCDGRWLGNGSTNWDTQSWAFSAEDELLFEAPEAVQRWESQTFAPRWQAGAKITAGDMLSVPRCKHPATDAVYQYLLRTAG